MNHGWITGTADVDALNGQAWREDESQTIERTPNPDCPACRVKRLHGADEWDAFHPEAGTGTTSH